MMDKNFTITAHCLVKNEENFVWYAIKSVIDFVDQIIIFDTGSTDETIDKIKDLKQKHPDKIIFEERGECDKKRHTELRQEMLDRTTTDWFMILDGDEIWTERGIEEAIKSIHEKPETECLIAPFYLCVGDIFHRYYKNGLFGLFGQRGFFSPRIIKRSGIRWGGDYGADTLYNKQGEIFFNEKNSLFLKNKYWHLTHLMRSQSDDNEYSSGGIRGGKRRLSYFMIGKKIKEEIPEIFEGGNFEMSFSDSFFNFFLLLKNKFFNFFRNNFVFPGLHESLVILTFLLIYAGMNSFVVNGDGSYGYAMVEKILDNQAFAPNDIVVNGSLASNFLFYKLLAYFPFYHSNFPLYDFLLSIPLTILLVLGWYNIFYILTKNRVVATASIIFTLLVDGRLSMGGTSLPFFYLTSLTSVYYLQIFSFYLFIIGRYWPSIIIASLTTYFHPAAGVFFLSVFFLTLILQSYKKRQAYRLIFKLMAVSLLIFIPNVFLLNKNLGMPVNTADFFEIFYGIKGGHAYLEDYFIRAYIYTLSASFLIFIFFKNKIIEYQDKILMVIYSIFAVVFIWLVNLYFIKNLKVFYLYSAMRSTYMIKPLFVALIIFIVYKLAIKNSIFSKIVSLSLLFSLILPGYTMPAALVFLAGLFMIFQEKIIHFEKEIFSKYELLYKLKRDMDGVKNNKKLIYSGILLIAFICTFLFIYRYHNKLYKIYNFARGENLFNFSFSPDKNFGWNKKDPSFGELIEWAKNYKGKMLIVPLLNSDFSTGFRFLTKNSTYITYYDMGQLSYIPSLYLDGYKRLQEVGFRQEGKREFALDGYDKLEIEKVKKLDADFIVFDKTSEGYLDRAGYEPVFENKKFIVYKLR
ncbi:MAG: glycosyltransferase [Patescibacteria group bacterium]